MRSKVSLVIASITLLFVFAGCSGRNKVTSKYIQFTPPQSGVVKAMTFNIRVGTALDGKNRWSKRKQMVIDTLVDNAADIISLQEALYFQVQQIQESLPQYSRYAIGRTDGKAKGESCAIFFRKDRFTMADCGTFWFSNNPSEPGSKYWPALFPRICSWVHLIDRSSSKGFYVYNVHLDSWSQEAREKSVRLLAKKIAFRKADDPFIVMGDFNMEIDNPAMQYLQNIGNQTPYPKMIDAWMAIGKPTVGTHHKFKGRFLCPKIDHIPISEDVQAINVSVDRRSRNGRYPSDHFPVTATVRIL